MARLALALLLGGPAAEGARFTRGHGGEPSESLLEAAAAERSGFPIARNLLHIAPALPGARNFGGAAPPHALGEPPLPIGRQMALAGFNWDLFGGEPERVKVEREANLADFPEEWRRILPVLDLRISYKGSRSIVVIGRQRGPLGAEVAVKRMDDGPIARNEVWMLRRLRSSGNVVAYLGSARFPNTTYIMMEGAEGTLHEHIKQRIRDGNAPRMPLKASLPILVDLLRGIIDLEESHIVHCDLWGGNVLMKGGRPLLSGFGLATVIDDSDIGTGCKDLLRTLDISADVSRLPPETIGGWPTGPSNNVYQVGAIFALMTLGHVPMQRVLEEHVPEVRTKAGRSDPSLLGRAQDLIRESFSLVEDPGFQALVDDDSKEILAGLLATDLDKRWTAVGALRAVLAIAERRRIPVPDARERAPKEVAVWVTSDWE